MQSGCGSRPNCSTQKCIIDGYVKPYLGDAAEGSAIMPGMGATVDIHTGTKSVIEYLVRPVLKLKAEAFRER